MAEQFAFQKVFGRAPQLMEMNFWSARRLLREWPGDQLLARALSR